MGGNVGKVLGNAVQKVGGTVKNIVDPTAHIGAVGGAIATARGKKGGGTEEPYVDPDFIESENMSGEVGNGELIESPNQNDDIEGSPDSNREGDNGAENTQRRRSLLQERFMQKNLLG